MKVRAQIELLATNDGGRSQPFIGSFRPNHRFNQNYSVIGEVEQPKAAALYPGETAELIVNFIPDGLPALQTGLRWTIHEGPKVIGYGTVREVLAL